MNFIQALPACHDTDTAIILTHSRAGRSRVNFLALATFGCLEVLGLVVGHGHGVCQCWNNCAC